MRRIFVARLAVALCAAFLSASPSTAAELRGVIIDAETGKPVAARLYIRASDGKWLHARSASPKGRAVEYRKQRSATCVEIHTSLSAHPFRAELPVGEYELTVERGKQYHPLRKKIRVGADGAETTLRIRRWIDLASRGWYSGETHVHRKLSELPTAMLAEDLNVGLPLTYWVTKSHTPPTQGNRNERPVRAELIKLDETHVIYPVNTEYEIFTVRGKRHTLGAFFAINHREVLKQGAPSVKPIAETVRKQGGILELDKHNWPWSMMLVPVMDVDLYELTNNHLWRTEFFFRGYGAAAAKYMRVESDEGGWTERGWIDFTMQNYYALLNCGFRMRPTAGCASGVHPVPLGFGRVFVHLPDGFSYDGWIDGLNRGRSFVTTGPMLDVKLNGRRSDVVLRRKKDEGGRATLSAVIDSRLPLRSLEIIQDGRVLATIQSQPEKTKRGGFRARIEHRVPIEGSTWLAVRCFAKTPEGRWRFAHSAPFHIDVEGRPLRPRRVEVQYLIDRVQSEIQRNQSVLNDAELAEFREALRTYLKIAETARH